MAQGPRFAGTHTEVGALEFRIAQPFKGFVLTPQLFSTSTLVLGPVLNRSGYYCIAPKVEDSNNKIIACTPAPVLLQSAGRLTSEEAGVKSGLNNLR